MWISTIVAGEFHVKQPFTDLPLQNFQIQPYNLPHALRAGELLKFFNTQTETANKEPRRIIINDVKIIAQAVEDKFSAILSEDESTMARLCRRAYELEQAVPRVVLLSEGFTPGRLSHATQDELSLPDAGS